MSDYLDHVIVDRDPHFIVDPDTRTITNNGTTSKLTIMQYDHNSEEVTFEIPRYIENHDMLKCDMILVLFQNTSKGTSASNRNSNSGVFQITNIGRPVDNMDGAIVCTWPISREATQYPGTLKFQLEFICHEDPIKGIEEYNWHTDQCDLITILPTLDSASNPNGVDPDIVTKFDARVTQLEEYGVPQDRVADAVAAYLAANPGSVMSDEDITAAIEAYLEKHPVEGGMTEDQLNAAIAEYLADHPVEGGVTEEQITEAIEDYLSENDISGSGALPLKYYADMFTTSKKIAKYESRDTSDDIFIRMEGSTAVWYRAVFNGSAKNLTGIYWIDEDHTSLTATDTDYPVTVYTYDEYVRMSMDVVDGEDHAPRLTFGEGYGYDDEDQGKFFIEKTSELMKMYLLNDSGNEIGLDISNNYLDLKGLRKPTAIDFTDVGFTVTMDGGGSMAYSYTKDDAGNITAITDQVGHITHVSFTITATASTEVE